MTPREILDRVNRWPTRLQEEWTERAAIIEEGEKVDADTADRWAFERIRDRELTRRAP